MVMKCRFFVLTILSFFFMACYLSCSDAENNSNSEVPSIEMDDEVDLQPVIGSEGGTFTMTFTASADWTASVNAVTRSVDWLSISPTQGEAGTVTLQVSVQPNETYDERNAAVLLTCGNAKQTITVTQKQKDALLVSSNKVEMDATGGTFGIELQSNVSVSYEIEESAKSWLTASPSSTTRGLTASTLSFQVTENPDNAVRQAVITLRGNDLTEQVTVYQAGSEPGILLSQKEYTVPSDGETIQVELKSNTSYKVVMPDVPWITEASTRAFSAYTHYFTVAANEGYDARTAEVVFVSEGDGTIADTVKIYQAYKGAIVVAQQEYEVKAEGDQLDFQVQTNLELEVSISDDWIKRVEARTRGLVEKQLCFDIEPNESDTLGREATITLRGKDTGISQSILVKQPAYVPVLDTVIYRTGYTWEEPHHNLPLLYYAHVERDRIYTNGKIAIDKFVNVGHPSGVYNMLSTLDDSYPLHYPTEGTFYYSKGNYDKDSITYKTLDIFETAHKDEIIHDEDSIRIVHCYAIISSNPQYCTYELWDGPNITLPGAWEDYNDSKYYDASLNLDKDAPFGSYPSSNRQSGWYFDNVSYSTHLTVRIPNDIRSIYRTNINVEHYDQYLVIDGNRIDFTAYYPDRTDKVTTENLPISDTLGIGVRFKQECIVKYLGRNFYGAAILDVYQRKYDTRKIYIFKFDYVKNGEDLWLGGGEKSIEVISNEAPFVTTDVDWIHLGNWERCEKDIYYSAPEQFDAYKYDLRYQYDANEGTESRIGHIYLKNEKGEIVGTYTAIQGGSM